MNKHIELVKKWLADPESVSLEELEDSKEAAYRGGVKAAWAEAVYEAAYWAVRAAKAAEDATYRATAIAAEATYWRNQAIKYVKQYEELTQ
jgi:hypothetical protein